MEHRVAVYHDTEESKIESLKVVLNDINSFLMEGEAWHKRSAGELRKNFIRGWGRWHEAEACFDEKFGLEFSKLCGDIPNIKLIVSADLSIIQKANNYTIKDIVNLETEKFDPEPLKEHHKAWRAREQRFINALNYAISIAGSVNAELYKYLYCMLEEVQNEEQRVAMVQGRLCLAGYSGHDIGICSMLIHKYFECDYDGGKIDFNIG